MKMNKNSQRARAPISLWGVGDWGVRTLERAPAAFNGLIEKVALNSDLQSLILSSSPVKIPIGKKSLFGLGSGGCREAGEKAFRENKTAVRERLNRSGLLIAVAGLGGGVGSGAAPALCRLALEAGVPVLAILTRPFEFEGKKRVANCRRALDDLASASVPYLCFSLDRMLVKIDDSAPCDQAFKSCDGLLDAALAAVVSCLAADSPLGGDLACLRNVFSLGEEAVVVTAGCDHPDKILATVKSAVSRLGLSPAELKAARGGLLCVRSSEPPPMGRVKPAMVTLSRILGEKSEIIFTLGKPTGTDGLLEIILLVGGVGNGAKRTADRPALIYNTGNLPARQGELPLGSDLLRGVFAEMEPILVNGEDLDIPTFIREGMLLG